jgi:ribosomal protein L9
MHRKIMFLALVALPIAGCTSSDPRERQADAIAAQARNASEALENQAATLAQQADAAGGYNGQVLDTRADALKSESKIVKRQGEARADAIKTQGDADAKQLRAQ